ncbi:MAG: hypothetical protein AVDCRST_MAG24-756, partial [uncultured Nocardioidaceae bacterium]
WTNSDAPSTTVRRASGKPGTISRARSTGKNGSSAPHTSWTGTSRRAWSAARSRTSRVSKLASSATAARRRSASRWSGRRKNSSNSPSSS